MNKNKIRMFSALWLISDVATSKPLSEYDLIELARKDNAAVHQRQIALKANDVAVEQIGLSYGSNLFGQVSYGENHHQTLIPQMPIYSPNTNLNIGIRERYNNGLSTELQAYTKQSGLENGIVDNITTTGIKAQVNFALFKNYLGEDDAAKLRSLTHSKEAQKLRNYIDERSYEMMVRKIYWSLVANRELLKIAEKIKANANQQIKEAKKRLQLSLGDAGEVSRYGAQVSDADVMIINLNYQFEKLLMSMKQLVPSLKDAEITLQSIDMNKTIQLTNKCIQDIAAIKETPWQLTKTDEYLGEIERSSLERQSEYRSLGKANVNLFAALDYAGVEEGYDQSHAELVKDGRPAFQIGLSFDMPLGEKFDRNTRLLIEKDQVEQTSLKLKFQAEADSRNAQMQKLIPLLMKTIESQKDSTKNLEKTAKDSQMKFEQARITVDRVIADQNAWTASMMNQINTQLIVIHEVYDYFNIFTEMPCEINKINHPEVAL